MENACVYFFLSALSYPFLAIYNSGAALFRAQGNSKVSMYTAMVVNIVNICLNALLIYVFQLGVAGAGIATLIARASAAIVLRTGFSEDPAAFRYNPENSAYRCSNRTGDGDLSDRENPCGQPGCGFRYGFNRGQRGSLQPVKLPVHTGQWDQPVADHGNRPVRRRGSL